MFEGIKSFFLKNKLKYKKLQTEMQLVQTIKEATTPNDRLRRNVEDDDEANWTTLNPKDSRSLSESDSITLREQAYLLYYRNPHARNIIRLFEKYIIGRGFSVIPQTDNEQAKEYWKAFWKHNKMESRKKEIVRRTMRDGECFLRYFKDIAKPLTVRFMNPDKVKNPDDNQKKNIECGIETNPNDVEDVKAYYYKDNRIDAKEVFHDKILVDSDVKRGRSFLECIAKYLTMYNRWLNDRMKLNNLRALVGLIKRVSGSPTQAANIASAYNTSKNNAPDGSYYHRAPDGVSMFTANKGVDYELKSPNLQASDVQHDGRQILLAISAGSGMPEFMVTSDSSNSNYASTLIAEAPATMEFEDWQDHFAILFKDMFERVILEGIDKKIIPQKEVITVEEEVVNEETGEVEIIEKEELVEISTECEIVFPEIVHRDILKETQALSLQYENSWISKRTVQSRLDLDGDFEDEQIKKEERDTEEPEDQFDKDRDMAISLGDEPVPDNEKEPVS